MTVVALLVGGWLPDTVPRQQTSRRNVVLGAGAAFAKPVAARLANAPLPVRAAGASSSESALRVLTDLAAKLDTCGRLVSGGRAAPPSPEALRQAFAIMEAREFEGKSLGPLLDALTQKESAVESAMQNAAFIIYYEERRYSDLRLEPKEPGLRAKENGFRSDLLRFVEDLRAELRFIVDGAGGAEADPEDFDDLRKYSRAASEALRSFIALTK